MTTENQNPQTQELTVETIPAVETPVSQMPSGIDDEIPFEQLGASQFDSNGRSKSDVEVVKEPEPEVSEFRLTAEQRERLRKNNPALFTALTAQEGEVGPTEGKAEYESSPLRKASDLFGKNSIAQPQTTVSAAQARRMAHALLALDVTDPRQATWLSELNTAMTLNPPEDFGLKALNREDSQWTQSLQAPGGQRIHNRVFQYPTRENKRLTGAAAVGYAAAISGSGRPSSIPLTSSGWNAVFRPATNIEWARYYEQILESRSELGRSTVGVGFGASRALYIEHALMFALDHLESTSFKMGDIEDRSEILRYLSVFDIDAFLTGFLIACHPDGYPIRMPCTNVGKCSAVTELDANLRTMMVYDRSSFTEAQLNHMLRTKAGEMTIESVLSYQASLKANQPKLASIMTSVFDDQEIKIEFQPCSAWEYIESSKRHIDRIKLSMQGLISDRTPEVRRMEIQRRYYWTAPLREYGHLVKRIILGSNTIEEDPDNKENPRLDIEDYLTRASESERMRTIFREEAIKFQQDALTNIVATPSYKCPSCGHGNDLSEGNKFLNCIPVDVPMVFFNRALLRLSELAGQ